MKKRWLIYILECSDGSLYTGATNDLEARLQRHRAGKGARYTRSRLPVRLAYREACKDHSSALRREYEVKRLKRKEKLFLVNKGCILFVGRTSVKKKGVSAK
jgi:putative endonuclease